MKKMKLFALLLVTVLCSFAPSDWVWMENKEAGFKILFPRQAVVSRDSVKSSAGKLARNILTHEVGKFKDDNLVYSLSFVDYPDTLISSEYKDVIIDNFMKEVIGTVVTENKASKLLDIKINYKEYPGRKVKMAIMDGKGFAYMQLYLVQSRLYLQSVSCEKEHDNNTAIDKFMKSFTLL